MGKPIFVIKVPDSVEHDNFVNMIKSPVIEEMRNDYHVLFVKTDVEDFEFQNFNSDEADVVKFDELQAKLLELATKNNN
jgi:hypothetical protein